MTTATYRCKCCGQPFTARVADRKRGWARFCSKSCKAKKQEARTGQHRAYQQHKRHLEESSYAGGGLCFPGFDEDSVQGH